MHSDPTWIVVADAHAARFFLRSRWGEPLRECLDLTDSAEVADRRHDPVSDVHNEDVDDPNGGCLFLHRVASEIDRAVMQHAARGLVLCAPPRELGLLRDYISSSSRERLTCELASDLVAAKLPAIEAAMSHLKA